MSGLNRYEFFRRAEGRTLHQDARRLAISPGILSEVVRGERTPSAHLKRNLEKAYSEPFQRLLQPVTKADLVAA